MSLKQCSHISVIFKLVYKKNIKRSCLYMENSDLKLPKIKYVARSLRNSPDPLYFLRYRNDVLKRLPVQPIAVNKSYSSCNDSIRREKVSKYTPRYLKPKKSIKKYEVIFEDENIQSKYLDLKISYKLNDF